MRRIQRVEQPAEDRLRQRAKEHGHRHQRQHRRHGGAHRHVGRTRDKDIVKINAAGDVARLLDGALAQRVRRHPLALAQELHAGAQAVVELRERLLHAPRDVLERQA